MCDYSEVGMTGTVTQLAQAVDTGSETVAPQWPAIFNTGPDT